MGFAAIIVGMATGSVAALASLWLGQSGMLALLSYVVFGNLAVLLALGIALPGGGQSANAGK